MPGAVPRAGAAPGVPGSGFTLLELMVAVAILAIISFLALPLYTSYSQRAFRGEAQANLLACALGMERWAGTEFTYQGAADTDGDGLGDADSGPVAGAICNTGSVGRGHYSIVVAATADDFLLTAHPVPEGPMAADGFLALDAAGNRHWDRDGNGTLGVGEDRWE